MKKHKREIHLGSIEQNYAPCFDLMTEDDDRMLEIKYIIFNELTSEEKNTILYYAECGSQRKLAEKLGVSLALTNHYLKTIQNKIKSKLNEKCQPLF